MTCFVLCLFSMIQLPPSPEAATPVAVEPDAPETRAERVARQGAMLREMAEITLRIARAEAKVALARTALAMNEADVGVAPAGGPRIVHPVTGGADPGLGISRISRSLRLTLAMETRLWDEFEAGPKAAAAERKPEPSPEQERRTDLGIRGVINCGTIVPIVEQAIEAEQDPKGDGSDTERRYDHLYERLEDEAEIVRFGTLPIGESIARLCAELGLKPDWDLWRDEDWAIEEAEARTPGSPYGRAWPTLDGADDAAREEAELATAGDVDPP